MKRIIRDIVKYLLPLLCGVWLFWYVYQKLDMNTIFQILKSDVNYFWIILSMVIAAFSHIARAFRWRLQLRQVEVQAVTIQCHFADIGTQAADAHAQHLLINAVLLRFCGS